MKNKTVKELLRELGIESVDTTKEHIGEVTLVFSARPPARRPPADDTREPAEKEKENNDEN